MMSKAFEELRRQVLTEVQKERTRSQHERTPDRAQIFGTFLQASLVNLGSSRAEFARKLNVEPEFADALLAGLLPASEIDETLLGAIAAAIGHEPNLLRIMLGRAAAPAATDADEDDDAYVSGD
jgi:hypothetical protein